VKASVIVRGRPGQASVGVNLGTQWAVDQLKFGLPWS